MLEALMVIGFILYIIIGRAFSTLYPDNDMKTFGLVFWPLIFGYWMLFLVVCLINRIVDGFVKWMSNLVKNRKEK